MTVMNKSRQEHSKYVLCKFISLLDLSVYILHIVIFFLTSDQQWRHYTLHSGIVDSINQQYK
jgi:hypothetical protein